MYDAARKCHRYASLANGGFKATPYFVERIEDREGNIVYQANPKRVCPYCNNISATPTSDDTFERSKPTPDDLETFALEGVYTKETKNDENTPYAQQIMSPQVAYIMQSSRKIRQNLAVQHGA